MSWLWVLIITSHTVVKSSNFSEDFFSSLNNIKTLTSTVFYDVIESQNFRNTDTPG